MTVIRLSCACKRKDSGEKISRWKRPTHVLLNESVVCERNSPPAYPGLPSLQNELTDRLQVGKSVGNINVFRRFENPNTLKKLIPWSGGIFDSDWLQGVH